MSASPLARRRPRLSGIVNPMFARYEIKGGPRRIPLTFSRHRNTPVSLGAGGRDAYGIANRV